MQIETCFRHFFCGAFPGNRIKSHYLFIMGLYVQNLTDCLKRANEPNI